ncbi:LysR family transcriptional regulator [Celeribacter arenosi]|uniref:LysR family transcriptional regulator n=1 Tax=Celeribacter arenosi TaxID=792649 RepID=A0ABP7JSB9_9RHOB
MIRNLDLTALRSFVAVADCGGVTRAAGYLNLTQSAVSMQIKRLEQSLDTQLFDRSSRSLILTGAGEQLLSYARRMLDLNDEVYGRLTSKEYEGEIVLGVPHDIVYPSIPLVLQQFHARYPRMRVNLVSSYTIKLREMFERGEADIILTTEDGVGPNGETIIELPLVWIGAIGGTAWRQRPIRLAFEHKCIFRKGVQVALDRAGIPWEMAIESDQTRTIEASVSADLAVHAILEGSSPPQTESIAHGGALPELASKKVNLYASDLFKGEPAVALGDLIRASYSMRAGRVPIAAQ